MAKNYDKYKLSTGTHYISNSGSDENKAYTGGKAGDQTGKEWVLKSWYNRPWTVVLRYPVQEVADAIADLAIAAALNDKIGYDQNQRTTYWKQLEAAKYDPSAITIACEADCTAGVSANVRAVGYIFGIEALKKIPICTSRNMRKEFVAAGFKALTDSKYLTSGKYLMPGDILLYENHHAATNITLGSAAKSSWHPKSAEIVIPSEPEEPTFEMEKPYVEATANVNVRKGPSTDYGIIRVADEGDRLKYFGFTAPNGWNLVECDKQTGWVSGTYSKLVT